jgi:DNA-binding NarL/FixJ family response regulator
VSSIRIVVADDHSVVREGLRRVLDSPGFEVVGEAANGDEAIALAKNLEPDVVVLDVSMKNGNGLSSIPGIREASPATRVLMLSVHEGAEYVARADRAGAHGYMLKDTSPGELRDAIRAVHEGCSFFGPSAATADAATATDSAGALATLTAREREVLTLIAGGRSNKEAAATLGISPRTVEAHRDSVMRKLGVRNAAGLTRIAIESGLID